MLGRSIWAERAGQPWPTTFCFAQNRSYNHSTLRTISRRRPLCYILFINERIGGNYGNCVRITACYGPRSYPPTDKTISIIVFVGDIGPRGPIPFRQRFPGPAMREMRGFGQTPCWRADLRVHSPGLSEARESPKNTLPEARTLETELGLPVRSTTS